MAFWTLTPEKARKKELAKSELELLAYERSLDHCTACVASISQRVERLKEQVADDAKNSPVKKGAA